MTLMKKPELLIPAGNLAAIRGYSGDSILSPRPTAPCIQTFA